MENALNFAALKKNLIDMVQEFQVKLGFSRDPVSLYYPLESLNRLLGAQLDAAGMRRALKDFAAAAEPELGRIAVSGEGERFCLRIPEAGVVYVRESAPDNGFLRDFVAATLRFGATIDDLLAVFRRYSGDVVCEELANGEFDYLIYFAGGEPDDYRYCVRLEPEHAVYHRFTPQDYAALGF